MILMQAFNQTYIKLKNMKTDKTPKNDKGVFLRRKFSLNVINFSKGIKKHRKFFILFIFNIKCLIN